MKAFQKVNIKGSVEKKWGRGGSSSFILGRPRLGPRGEGLQGRLPAALPLHGQGGPLRGALHGREPLLALGGEVPAGAARRAVRPLGKRLCLF